MQKQFQINSTSQNRGSPRITSSNYRNINGTASQRQILDYKNNSSLKQLIDAPKKTTNNRNEFSKALNKLHDFPANHDQNQRKNLTCQSVESPTGTGTSNCESSISRQLLTEHNCGIRSNTSHSPLRKLIGEKTPYNKNEDPQVYLLDENYVQQLREEISKQLYEKLSQEFTQLIQNQFCELQKQLEKERKEFLCNQCLQQTQQTDDQKKDAIKDLKKSVHNLAKQTQDPKESVRKQRNVSRSPLPVPRQNNQSDQSNFGSVFRTNNNNNDIFNPAQARVETIVAITQMSAANDDSQVINPNGSSPDWDNNMNNTNQTNDQNGNSTNKIMPIDLMNHDDRYQYNYPDRNIICYNNNVEQDSQQDTEDQFKKDSQQSIMSGHFVHGGQPFQCMTNRSGARQTNQNSHVSSSSQQQLQNHQMIHLPCNQQSAKCSKKNPVTSSQSSIQTGQSHMKQRNVNLQISKSTQQSKPSKKKKNKQQTNLLNSSSASKNTTKRLSSKQPKVPKVVNQNIMNSPEFFDSTKKQLAFQSNDEPNVFWHQPQPSNVEQQLKNFESETGSFFARPSKSLGDASVFLRHAQSPTPKASKLTINSGFKDNKTVYNGQQPAISARKTWNKQQ